MAIKWIMYIPRDRNLASTKDTGNKPSLIDRAKGWRQYVEQKKNDNNQDKYEFSVKCLGEGLPKSLGENDMIYVFAGHGIAGRDGVGWPGDNGNLIDAKTIVQRLKAEGLPKDFKGKIKVYSCHSGDDANNQSAFAYLVDQELKAHAKDCSVFGYHGEITQSYELIDLNRPTHKGKYQGDSNDAGTHRWSIINRPFYAGCTSKNREEY